MKIVQLSERARHLRRRADALDEALDSSLAREPLASDFAAEIEAAHRLARAQEITTAPPEALIALRASLASRAAAPKRAHSHLWFQAIPSAVAAACVALVVNFMVSGPNHGPQTDAQRAAVALQEITARMAAVNQIAKTDDRSGVVQAAQSARQSLLAAQQVAAPLPADSPYRDLLLQTAEAKIAELESLLAQLQLPPIPSLPPVAGKSGPSTTGALAIPAIVTTTTTSTTTTSTTTSSTTTTTTQPSGSTTTTTTSGQPGTATAVGQQSGPSGTKQGSSGSTQSGGSSSTTSSTTPVPPPPSTTTTTSPPPPGG